MEKALEPQERTARKKVEEWVAKPGNSNNRFASAAGISAATLSAWMRGTYKGSNKNVIEKINQYFSLEGERQAVIIETEYVLTRQAKTIERFCVMAHAYNQISVIVGDSGLGKTTALKIYSQKPNTYYIKCHPYMRGRVSFLQQIALSLNLPTAGNQIVLFNRICDLASAGGKMLILDDAQALNPDSGPNTTIFEVIRALHDLGMGIVIAGNNKVRDSVTTKSDESFYQQMAARMNVLVVEPKFSEKDFDQVIHGLMKGRLKKEEFEYLLTIANQYYGGLHLVIRILTLAVTRGQKQNTPMSRRLLEEAAKHSISQLKPQYRTSKKGAKRNASETKEIDSDNQHLDEEEKVPQTCVA